MVEGVCCSLVPQSHLLAESSQYAGKTNPTLEPAISLHVQNFIDLLKLKYLSTEREFKPLDLGRKASFFTMDVITDIAFGQSFGNLVQDEDMYDYIQNTEDMIPMILKLSALPTLRTLFQSRFGALMFPSDKSDKGVGKLLGYVLRCPGCTPYTRQF